MIFIIFELQYKEVQRAYQAFLSSEVRQLVQKFRRSNQ